MRSLKEPADSSVLGCFVDLCWFTPYFYGTNPGDPVKLEAVSHFAFSAGSGWEFLPRNCVHSKMFLMSMYVKYCSEAPDVIGLGAKYFTGSFNRHFTFLSLLLLNSPPPAFFSHLWLEYCFFWICCGVSSNSIQSLIFHSHQRTTKHDIYSAVLKTSSPAVLTKPLWARMPIKTELSCFCACLGAFRQMKAI